MSKIGGEGSHWVGCHEQHIDCANRKIMMLQRDLDYANNKLKIVGQLVDNAYRDDMISQDAYEHIGTICDDYSLPLEGGRKFDGSDHYKTAGVEPFDLIKAGGMFWDKCIADIIKYAFRNRRDHRMVPEKINESDLQKIIHLTNELIAWKGEQK